MKRREPDNSLPPDPLEELLKREQKGQPKREQEVTEQNLIPSGHVPDPEIQGWNLSKREVQTR